MKKKIIGFVTLLALSMLLSTPFALAKPDDVPRGPPLHIDEPEAVIYVTSQGMYYHTIVPYASNTLPYNGHNGKSFQELVPPPDVPNPPPAETPYGPGDPGYKGGRWWIDLNGNGEMDPEGPETGGDHYFLCPLLGPGMSELPT